MTKIKGNKYSAYHKLNSINKETKSDKNLPHLTSKENKDTTESK